MPGLLLLAAIPLARAAEAFGRGERRKSGAMWAGVAILWLAPHLPGYAPRTDLVEFNLGTLAARAGDYAAAKSRFERAVELAPDSDDAYANLGGALLALGDAAGAESGFTRALELNPENRFARHNLEVLRKRAAGPV